MIDAGVDPRASQFWGGTQPSHRGSDAPARGTPAETTAPAEPAPAVQPRVEPSRPLPAAGPQA
jgi:hypothetical protein